MVHRVKLKSPKPGLGWSREVDILRDAVVVPASERGLVQKFGVFDRNGAFKDASTHWRHERCMTNVPTLPTADLPKLAGRHLYCGELYRHFGHFLTESLVRTWAKTKVEGIQSLLYLPRDASRSERRGGPVTDPNFDPFHRQILDWLKIDVPAQLVTAPIRVEELVLPGQGFGLGAISAGTPEFHALIETANAAFPAPQERAGRKIYISRTSLFLPMVGLFFEDRLEDALRAQGYEVYAPQNESIAHQIATYRSADVILGLDGSPFHLLGLVGLRHQKIGLIQRRKGASSTVMVQQIKGFTGMTPDIFSCVTAEWMPNRRIRAGQFHFGVLDFAKLHTDLVASGFIAPDPNWPDPNADDIVELVKEISAQCNFHLEQVPDGMSALQYRRRMTPSFATAPDGPSE